MTTSSPTRPVWALDGPGGASRDRLAHLVREHGDDLPLDEAAALIAAEEDPSLRPEDALDALDALAAAVHVPPGAPVFEAVARLNQHLFGALGFQGDTETYDEPTNSLLHRVVARRRGLPILLSVVYIEVARRAGVPVLGIGFPSHFLVSPREADPPFYVDPFYGGRALRREQLQAWLARLAGRPVAEHELSQALAPVSPRHVAIRMGNNLFHSYLRREEPEAAVRALGRLVLLDPADARHLRHLAELRAEIGQIGGAIGALEAYLEAWPDAYDAASVRARVEALRAR